jgi:hypothetical protein
MVEHDINQLPVLRGRQIVGMLDRSDVMRYIQVRRELDEQPVGRKTDPGDEAPATPAANPRAS